MFEQLTTKALSDKYFHELFAKAEKYLTYKFFQIDSEDEFTEKEYVDLLRFADIFSNSKNHEARNKAYKIISLLVEDKKEDNLFKVFSTAILTKLGNFPAIKFLEDHYSYAENLPHERELEKILKLEAQKVPNSEFVFTDSQFKIFEALKNHNHFSFSGPTSLGKSFILESFIYHIVNERGGKENIIVLVPTRALINQVSIRLKKILEKNTNHRVLVHPIVPEIFKKAEDRYVFVFTPERLIAFLSELKNPKIDYLFVDEAQKIISEKDTRSPLYYHSILQAERKSIKLYFSSPNIPNPEIFLQLFEKSTEEKISIQESPVSQNRYFLDLIDNKCLLLSDLGKEVAIPIKFESNDFFFWLKKLGAKEKNIVYCNTITDTIEYAINFSRQLNVKQHPRIDELIKTIEETIHKQYYLIDCLKKGVAYHFGKLPQNVRLEIEDLFSKKIIDTIFCTSTLLEGVNLPAKNIFILSNAIGLSKFTDIDFWNLAGRAGRLAKELSGNIICLRAVDKKNRWDNVKDLEIIKSKNINPIKPLIINGQKNFFLNLENSLTGKPFSNKSASQTEKTLWNYYANISLLHEIRDDESVLRSSFIENNPKAREILKKQKDKNLVPYSILASSTTIKAKYQNVILNNDIIKGRALPEEVDYDTVLKHLNVLYREYNWIEEESGGHNPLIKKSPKVLEYYAVIMSSWINSDALNKMINASIKHYVKVGQIWIIDAFEIFDPKSKRHINLVINELISDIDNILRFKLEMYFNNYYLLLKEKFGIKRAGKNWAEYLEYGTTDSKIIELQNVGFPRHLAKYILENHRDCFKFDEGVLVEFDQAKLMENFNQKLPEYKELKEIIGLKII
jgi:superfamily II DNA/RNA helicase